METNSFSSRMSIVNYSRTYELTKGIMRNDSVEVARLCKQNKFTNGLGMGTEDGHALYSHLIYQLADDTPIYQKHGRNQ